jgi:hypothetical protein
MLVGHLVPVGPIAAAVERRWDSEWPRWTRALPWAAALTGCIFPDCGIIANALFNKAFHHLYYLPHSLFPYLPVLLIGWLLVRRERTRLLGLTARAFWMGVLSHLLLDAVSHGTVLFYPLWNGVVGWSFPHTHGHILRSYFHSPNFWLEPVALFAAVLWWLRRYASAWWKIWFAGKGEVTLGYLSALPRHEGSRLIQLDRSRRVER